MRISELVERSGVPLPTVKFYLREGLLMPGTVTGRTRAEYGEEHLHRLGVIRALIELVGLSVQQVRRVLALTATPVGSPLELYGVLGAAVGTLPPEVPAGEASVAHPRARDALERLGQIYDPDYAAVAQLERAIAAAEASGVLLTDARLDAYGRAARDVARFDLDQLPPDPAEAVEYAVLGTALYEPLLIALRRLAHQDLAARRLGVSPSD
ncbi:MAG TPA: MerR family transcriptional regulator [Gryllotalpicola sp.]